MPRFDFVSPRLFVDAPLSEGVPVPLERAQAHYLTNVLRLPAGSTVLAFNGRDGEWQTIIEGAKARSVLRPLARMRPQPPGTDLHYCFAPLKHARLDYLVQKAVEMGASLLQPVLTRRTQVARLNGERMRANGIEAAEQCGILSLPEIREPIRFDALLAAWPQDRLMIFCDEDAETADPVAALQAAAALGKSHAPRSIAVIIGPEGGFDDSERAALLALPLRLRLSLGPRILRADTAAVAALALIQACLGDWV